MNIATNIGVGYKGERVGGEPENETDHFFICRSCGQTVDMRDLGHVFHHEEKGHKPIDNN